MSECTDPLAVTRFYLIPPKTYDIWIKTSKCSQTFTENRGGYSVCLNKKYKKVSSVYVLYISTVVNLPHTGIESALWP